MKKLLPIVFIILCMEGICQKKNIDSLFIQENNNSKFEFTVLPLIGFNKVEIGISKKTPNKLEHALYASSSLYFIGTPSFNLNISYNLNRFLKNNKNYMPFWVRISNTRHIVGYEQGYFPHTLRYSIGTGFGRLFQLSKKFFLRSEIGIGVSLNLTNSSGDLFPVQMNFSEYKFDKYYPQHYPPILPALRLKLNFIYRKTTPNN